MVFVCLACFELTEVVFVSGNLANYQAKYLPDYALGMQRVEETTVVRRPEPQRKANNTPEEVSIKPAEEDDTSTWSSSTTSDLLF